jgi:hypothetical protein
MGKANGAHYVTYRYGCKRIVKLLIRFANTVSHRGIIFKLCLRLMYLMEKDCPK